MNDNTTNRLTKITTPSGFVVTLLEWITGRELKLINAPLYSSVKVKQSANGQQDISAISAEVTTLMDDVAISVVVKGIEPHPLIDENAAVLDKVLDMPVQDYNAILLAVKDAMGGTKKNEMMTSSAQ